MSAPAFSRFAFALRNGIRRSSMWSRGRTGLALFTVYPSLGIVLLGMHRSRDVADPAWIFSRPRCCGTAGPPQPPLARSRSALLQRVSRYLVALVLAGVGVGRSFDRNDGVRLPDHSLVPTIIRRELVDGAVSSRVSRRIAWS